MEYLEEAINLISKYNYLVKVKQTGDPAACEAHFPNTKLINQEISEDIWYYKLKLDEPTGIEHYSKKRTHKSFLNVPDYALRIVLLSDIFLRTESIPYPSTLIVFEKQDGTRFVNPLDATPLDMDPEIVEKEEVLGRLIIDSREDDFDEAWSDLAADYEVGEGYEILKELYLGV